MRSKAARMSNGASTPLPTSMIWPRPPRVRPAPPEIRAQLLAPEDQWRLRLRDLDRGAAYAAGIGRGRQSILGKTRAGAAVARHRHREPVIAAGTAARLAAHIEIPQAGRTFGRHPLRNDLTQAAEHHIGQHLADDMARRHRRRLRRIKDRARRRRDSQQRERPCIIRDLRGDHASRGRTRCKRWCRRVAH